MSSDQSASLAAMLWRDSLEVAERCREHPFVQGIASGELERAAFQHYVAQDAFFLEAFARAYALSAEAAPDAASTRELEALRLAVDEELELHRAYAERWEVELAADPTPATRAYTDFLLEIAANEAAGHTAAAMAPCMRLYAWLGQQLEPIAAPASPYKEWIDTYASADFEAAAARLETLLDALVVDTVAAAVHYAKAMELELAFFDSALAGARV